MKIVFLGTPDIAAPTLATLAAEGHAILMAVSQPDRPAGRGRKVSSTPVKKRAEEMGIPVFQPADVNSPESIERIRLLKPDVIVVVAFGQLLKKDLLDIPPLGCVNLHASLLPLLRGAAPINRAIMEGHAATGVATMRMNRRMDAGDIYLTREIPLTPEMTAGDLHDAVMTVGAGLMAETLRKLAAGGITPVPQDESGATFAPKILPAERAIDWSLPADALDRKIRGLSPSPGAFTFFRGKRIVLLRTAVAAGEAGAAPGTIVAAGAGHLEAAAGNGKLTVLEVCQEGKTPMGAMEWMRGARITAGVDSFRGNQETGS